MEPSAPSAERGLRQFGYDVFRTPATTFAPVEDVPVGPDYMLGPGDSLTIYVWGLVESVFSETVNRNGEIFVPRAGTLKVWGLTFEKAEQLIRDQLGKVYTGFQISVTLGRLRTIRVFVVGSVARPGSYVLSALSTVTNALFAAGGPSKQGTLRRIQLLRDNRALSEIDFYDFLLRGDKKGDVRLESGDTVFVPQIGPVVALVGRVNQPAIYELKTETRMADLLTLAGGVTPRGYLERVQLERFRANRERVVEDVNLLDFYQRGVQESNPALKNGDLVRVFPVDLRIYNAVSLEGLVKRPGRYELRPRMRVADLVIRDELLPDAYLDRAEVVRVREDLGTEVIPFSIREAWQGKPEANLELRPLDRVVIRSQMRPIEEVVVTGMVKRPGQYAITRGERLSGLIERAGGLEAGAFPEGRRLHPPIRPDRRAAAARTVCPDAGAEPDRGELGGHRRRQPAHDAKPGLRWHRPRRRFWRSGGSSCGPWHPLSRWAGSRSDWTRQRSRIGRGTSSWRTGTRSTFRPSPSRSWSSAPSATARRCSTRVQRSGRSSTLRRRVAPPAKPTWTRCTS